MKINVSYISSLYNQKKTIDLINETNADGIHVDLMDGSYVGNSNFSIDLLPELFKDNTKPLDIHMMVDKPSRYLDKIISLYPDCIYIHPRTEQGIIGILSKLSLHEIKRGIVINPDEDINDFAYYFPYVDRILLMSVNPGKGGQTFIDDTTKRLDELLSLKESNNFEIYIDGGINDKTITNVLKADGVISGAFVCNKDNFEVQIEKLRNRV